MGETINLNDQRSSVKSLRECLPQHPTLTPNGASETQILGHLAALVLIFPQQELSENEARVKFRIYCEDLAHVPNHILARACKQYRLNPANDFFPSPGKLFALCEIEMKNEREMAQLDRLGPAPALPGPYPEPVPHPRPLRINTHSDQPKDVVEVKELIQEFQQDLSEDVIVSLNKIRSKYIPQEHKEGAG